MNGDAVAPADWSDSAAAGGGAASGAGAGASSHGAACSCCGPGPAKRAKFAAGCAAAAALLAIGAGGGVAFLGLSVVRMVLMLFMLPVAQYGMPLVVRYLYMSRIGSCHVTLGGWLQRRFSGGPHHSRSTRVVVPLPGGGEAHVHTIATLGDNYAYLIVDATPLMEAVLAGHPGSCPPLAGVLVDPADADAVLLAVAEICEAQYGAPALVELQAVLTTHKHWDHAGGNVALAKLVGDSLRIFGSSLDDVMGANEAVDGGDAVHIGSLRFDVLATPSHTEGSLAFVLRGDRGRDCLFSGDCVFLGGCGAPFEGGMGQMQHSFATIALNCGPATLIFPGHEYTEMLLSSYYSEGGQNGRGPPSRPKDMLTLATGVAMARHCRSRGPLRVPTVPRLLAEEAGYNCLFLDVRERAECVAAAYRMYTENRGRLAGSPSAPGALAALSGAMALEHAARSSRAPRRRSAPPPRPTVEDALRTAVSLASWPYSNEALAFPASSAMPRPADDDGYDAPPPPPSAHECPVALTHETAGLPIAGMWRADLDLLEAMLAENRASGPQAAAVLRFMRERFSSAQDVGGSRLDKGALDAVLAAGHEVAGEGPPRTVAAEPSRALLRSALVVIGGASSSSTTLVVSRLRTALTSASVLGATALFDVQVDDVLRDVPRVRHPGPVAQEAGAGGPDDSDLDTEPSSPNSALVGSEASTPDSSLVLGESEGDPEPVEEVRVDDVVDRLLMYARVVAADPYACVCCGVCACRLPGICRPSSQKKPEDDGGDQTPPGTPPPVVRRKHQAVPAGAADAEAGVALIGIGPGLPRAE